MSDQFPGLLSSFYESTEHADGTVLFALEIKFVLKIESNAWGI